MTRVAAVLTELLALAPPVPADADAATLIAGADAGMRARRGVLEAVGERLAIVTSEEVALFAELEARRASWEAAVARAHMQLGQQLVGLRRVRAYAAQR